MRGFKFATAPYSTADTIGGSEGQPARKSKPVGPVGAADIICGKAGNSGVALATGEVLQPPLIPSLPMTRAEGFV